MFINEIKNRMRTYAIEFEKGTIDEYEYVNLLKSLETDTEANDENELQEIVKTIESLIDIVRYQITT